MSGVLDDMDSRPGSTTSLLRTIVGLYFRDAGGWVAAADIVELMRPLNILEPQTRTAVARVKAKGVLRSELHQGRSGYAVEPMAQKMLDRGDRRIFTPRRMDIDDGWCVISYSLSERHRQLRTQLRRRLHWIGCGSIAPGLSIAPYYLEDEILEIADSVGVRPAITVFRAGPPIVDGDLSAAVARWWDLTAIAARHREFIAAAAPLEHPATSLEASFEAYVRSIDSWRVIPYVDPGLPEALLPDDWPGRLSAALFGRIRDTHEKSSAEFVRTVMSVFR